MATTSGTVRRMAALARSPFWLRMALVVLALGVGFAFLGRWQYGRHLAKVERNAAIDANYRGAPVSLPSVLPSVDAPLAEERTWVPVRLVGSYEPQHRQLVRNRPFHQINGFEVIVPLRLASGAAVLVDRGWVPAGEEVAEPDAVPAPPTGQVTVVVRLRPGEQPVDREPPPGQQLRIDLARLAAVAGGPVYRGAYGLMASEVPAPATVPQALPPPDEDLGPHLAYAWQWWMGDAALVLLYLYYLRREARSPAEAPAGRVGGPGPDGAPAARPRRPLVRRRAGGPTDEEWEDAATGG